MAGQTETSESAARYRRLTQEWVEARALATGTFFEDGHARTVSALAALPLDRQVREADWQRRLAFAQGRAQGLEAALDILNGREPSDAEVVTVDGKAALKTAQCDCGDIGGPNCVAP